MASGHYIYTDHLLCLAGRRASHPIDLPQHLWPVNTPLNPRAWASHLQSHPDRAYVDYIVQGIRHGFRLGFAYSAVKLRSASRNMRSADENPEVVEHYLAKECGLGRVVGLSRKFWSGGKTGPGEQIFRNIGPGGPFFPENFGPPVKISVRPA